MGGQSTEKQTNRMAQQGWNQEMGTPASAGGGIFRRPATAATQGQFQQFENRNEADTEQARNQSNALRQQILGGYTSLLGGVDANGNPISGGGGGGGGFAATGEEGDPRFAESENSYRNFMLTGGWDPNRTANVDIDIGRLREMGRTGGVNDESIGRIRGGGVFDEFAQTGGYSDQNRRDIRSRGTSVIPAMYDRLKQEAGRQSMVQGGYGPGKVGMMGRLARNEQQGLSDAALNAELGIMDKVNAGRQWGGSLMSGAELELAKLQSQNKLQGSLGAGGLETGLVDSQNRGKMFGTSGLEGMAQSKRQADLQAASINASRGASSAALDLQRQFGALGGLSSLYSAVPEEYMQYRQMDMQNRLANAQIGQGWLGSRQDADKGFGDYLGSIAGIGQGILGRQWGKQQPRA